MPALPPGWETDLAVLRHGGSTVEDHGDHLVVRSPHNPTFHWGNCLFVLDDDGVADADRWVTTFQQAFPEATWVSIGLTRLPADQAAWTALGLEVELDDVLTTRRLPELTPLTSGYVVRRLGGGDWDMSLARSIEENSRTAEHDPEGFARFAEARIQTRRAMSDREGAAWFGAFHDGGLVAELGIVRCGSLARYQSVVTEPAHRQRGLAAHLLGVAARWSAEGGCEQWVIVTGSTNPAGRLYRSVGFEPDSGNVQAYRSSRTG